MPWIVQNLWLIPALPLAAAAVIAVTKRPHRRFAATMTIGTMAFSLLLALCAFAHTLEHGATGETTRQVFNFEWFHVGGDSVQIGWVLDPLTAVMLVMVSLVSLLIFVYSTGYMAHDDNFTRFFCFLSLFAAAMLGVVIANSLLLFFVCWELVGLSSYLLIGFWYHKPSAAAAAKKAFITTRIGDVVFFLGMLLLYSHAHTLLFYDKGNGCLESSTLSNMVGLTTTGGMMVTTAIGLLIFCGAAGKSGQVPLHVWLPDAMEGPTPVSALIHAATMVAAGVFLIARVYPILDPGVAGVAGGSTAALTVVTWVGAVTAVFAACIAVAQTDIKRILAYSTVSQLGFMMMGLGVGGVAVGMFHLITHAFFKALLFLGAGSVIHGCHEEQDIRKMGGLRKYMPVTFAAYAVGMMALSGVPIFFSGFWSKDEILHAAHQWPVSPIPFCMGVFGALLTAFYMTRQMFYVFAGTNRGGSHAYGEHAGHAKEPHESPAVMTVPLVVLAAFAMFLGFFGTPAWPWFQNYLTGEHAASGLGELFRPEILFTLSLSTVVVAVGIGLGWRLYGRKPIQRPSEPDALERPGHPVVHDVFIWLKHKLYVDEIYEATIIRFNAWWAAVCNALDLYLWNGLVLLASYLVVGLSWVNRAFDEFVINLGFDAGCGGVGGGGRLLSRLQNGRVQDYLRVIGVALAALALLLMWGVRGFMNGHHVISIVTFTPLIGAIVLAFLKQSNRRLAQGLALAFCALGLLHSLMLWVNFDAASGQLQFVERADWIPSIHVDYFVGVDGLGLLMVALTAIVTPVAILASRKIEDKAPQYYSLMLFLQAGLFGTFTALNFVHWFLFWELSLVPAFLLIKFWGGPGRSAAATQFFIYTMVGSVAMLLAFLAIYQAVGTFDFMTLAKQGSDGTLATSLNDKYAGWHWLTQRHTSLVIFAGVFLGFAVKVPLIPFHTWLPATYAEAPTGTTMMLTGLMSKMGVYGFLRVLLPLFPSEMRLVLTPLLWLAVVTIVCSACAAFAQKDLKRVFAYSSINHLGYCLLGIFATITISDRAGDKAAALNGVLLQMFSHGLTAPMLFCFVGFLEQRSGGARGLDDFGGLRKVAPVFCGLMGISIFASLGLPGLNGFVGEFLIFKGSFPLATWATALSVIGLLVTAIFLLTVIQRVFNGPLNEKWAAMPDLDWQERFIVLPATALMFLIGICPQILIGAFNTTVMQMVDQLKF